MGVGGTLAGGMGLSAETGIVFDMRDGLSMGVYFSGGPAYGVDASIGLKGANHVANRYSSDFSISDLDGWSSTHNYGASVFEVSHGSNSLYSSYGGGIAPKYSIVGYTYNRMYTKTFSGRVW